MTTLIRASYIRIGRHLANDYSSVPASLKFLRAAGMPVLVGRNVAYNERDSHQTGDGSMLPGFQGGQEISVPDIPIEMRGLSGGGAGDAVDTDTLSLEVDDVLAMLFGSEGIDSTGETSTGTPGSGTTLNTATSTDTGECARLIMGADGKYHARIQVSAAAGVSTLERALKADNNGALAPGASEVVYAGRLFNMSVNNPDVRHLYFDAEDGDDRVEIFGCLADGSFGFDSGGSALLTLSGIMATSHASATKDNPSYTEPTRGLPIKVLAAPLFIGADLYQAHSLSLSLGVTNSPRQSDHGPNNNWGHVRGSPSPVLSGTIRAGTSTTPLELTRALLNTLRGDTLQDVAFQIGREPGRAMYVRLPTADVRIGDPSDSGGQKVYPFEARGTGVKPLQLAVF